jgi:hypothetical protein
MRKQIIQISSEKNNSPVDVSHPTIFHSLLDSNLPDSEKSVERLTDEANTIIGAGQETVAVRITICLISSSLLSRKKHPHIYLIHSFTNPKEGSFHNLFKPVSREKMLTNEIPVDPNSHHLLPPFPPHSPPQPQNRTPHRNSQPRYLHPRSNFSEPSLSHRSDKRRSSSRVWGKQSFAAHSPRASPLP